MFLAISIVSSTYVLYRTPRQLIQDAYYFTHPNEDKFDFSGRMTEKQENEANQIKVVFGLLWTLATLWFIFIEALMLSSIRYLQKIQFGLPF